MTKYTDYFPKPYSVLVTNSDTEEEVKALLKKRHWESRTGESRWVLCGWKVGILVVS